MGVVRFGTSGWSAAGWVGSFYPPGTKPADFLTHYATHFDTVEADTTYYHRPSWDRVEGWRRKTPEGFTLACKFPRDLFIGGGTRPLTPEAVLPSTVSCDVRAFHNGHLSVLKEKAGPVLIQLPYFNSQVFKDLSAFLDRLDPFLAGVAFPGCRQVVEVRNREWLHEELLAVLRTHGVALGLVDVKSMPHADELADQLDLVTSDFFSLRLVGDREATETHTRLFDRVVVDQSERLARWARLIRRLSAAADGFVYAHNHYAGHAPATAKQLRQLVEGGE